MVCRFSFSYNHIACRSVEDGGRREEEEEGGGGGLSGNLANKQMLLTVG